jgi:glycosyltransferase involved in cell wall biosynthesis
MNGGKPKRILYVLRQYPQVTETYMESELRALEERGHTVDVIALNVATDPRRRTHSFRYVPQDDEAAIAAAVAELAPDVVHSHELDTARRAYEASRAADVPFTLRTHSYDVMGLPLERMRALGAYLNDERCVGVLGFPFAAEPLIRAGVDEGKIRTCFPVVDYARFHDESANGEAVMNLGSCQPKKGMGLFVELARRLPEREFNLWAVGFGIEDIRALNESLGGPVNLMPRTEHDEMPAQYKRHQWLVYTAAERTVGWPVAIAEAQAAGVGVCMQRIRPDVEEYVGDGGFLFDTVEEVEELISQPPSPDLRRRGFAQAAKSDVREHIAMLEQFWDAA